ncbi:hypothetical protein B0H16DRAFT_1666082 [Mycena metata]|uniref:Reverse transcriptase zinc-binding domain-containing protein n=1 Tax=Mycena metata TaxID=1033252 RepID=A0AAD7MML8_9AGAR|nr:hypothetical protein B0H16DRAFT_1666082 [Mycena metata]
MTRNSRQVSGFFGVRVLCLLGDYARHGRHLTLGAKLSTLTQAAAYRGIQDLKKRTTRKTTEENIKLTQIAVKEIYKRNPTPASIWKIGKFWLHIPEMDDRANCQHCGMMETMEHILVECSRPGQAEIWALARELWTLKHPSWPQISLGSILGSGLATFRNTESKILPHTARLYRILISESMYLIWKIRCEVVIAEGGVPKSATEIHNRQVALMNERLNIDRTLTNRERTLMNEEKLPEKWLSEPEVLVGIAPIGSLRPLSPPSGRRGRNR